MVDNLTFDDGEPITNTKLQSLYNAIKTLEGDVAKTTITNTLDQAKYTSIVYSGRSEKVKIGSGNSVPITFQGFQTDDVHVIVTPYRSSNPTKGAFNYSVWNVSKSGATILFTNTDTNFANKETYFEFVAVEMRKSS